MNISVIESKSRILEIKHVISSKKYLVYKSNIKYNYSSFLGYSTIKPFHQRKRGKHYKSKNKIIYLTSDKQIEEQERVRLRKETKNNIMN